MDSLRFLADNTGGTAIARLPGDRGGLRRAAAGRGRALLPGGLPLDQHQARRPLPHLVARVTTRPGVRVRVRRGYRGPTPDELLSDARAARRARGRAPGGRAVAVSARRRSASAPRRGPAPTAARSGSWASWIPRLRRELVWTADGEGRRRPCWRATARRCSRRTIDVPPAETAFALRVPGAGRGDARRGLRGPRPHLPRGRHERRRSPTRRGWPWAARREELSEPLVWRRGPTTGPRYVQTAEPRASAVRSGSGSSSPTRLDGDAAGASGRSRRAARCRCPVRVDTRADDRTTKACAGWWPR